MSAESSKEIPGKGECACHVRVGEREHFLPWLVNPGEEAAAAEWWGAGRRMALGMGDAKGMNWLPSPSRQGCDCGTRFWTRVASAQWTRFRHDEVEQAVERLRLQGRAPDLLALPEGWAAVRGPLDVQEAAALRKLAEVSRRQALFAMWGTMEEQQPSSEPCGSKSHYVTAFATDAQGLLAGTYRKRCAVSEGSHLVGSHPATWQSPMGPLSALVCFDIENEPLLAECLASRPRLLLNPSHIPPPAHPSAGGASAARDTVARALEQISSSSRVAVAKIDPPWPRGYGITLTIDPCITSSLQQHDRPLLLSHYLPADDYASIDSSIDRSSSSPRIPSFIPPLRPRTERRDQTGDRVHLAHSSRHTAPVLQLAAIPSSGGFQKTIRAASCSNLEVAVWNPVTGEQVQEFGARHLSLGGAFTTFTAVAMPLHPALPKHTVLVATAQGQVITLDPSHQRQLQPQFSALCDRSSSLLSLQAPSSPELPFLATTSAHTVLAWDPRSPDAAAELPILTSQPTRHLTASPAATPLFAIATGDTVRVYDHRQPAQPIHQWVFEGSLLSSVEFGLGGRSIAVGDSAGQLFLQNLSSPVICAGGAKITQLGSPITAVSWVTEELLCASSLQHGAILFSIPQDASPSLALSLPIDTPCSSIFEGHNMLFGCFDGRVVVARAEQNRNHLPWSKAILANSHQNEGR